MRKSSQRIFTNDKDGNEIRQLENEVNQWQRDVNSKTRQIDHQITLKFKEVILKKIRFFKVFVIQWSVFF